MIYLENTNIALLISESFFLTASVILFLRPIAFKIGLIDKPCPRKKHQIETPMIGGLAIYLTLAFIILTNSVNTHANIPFLIAATIIVITGLIDDYRDLNFKARLVSEVIAAFIMAKWGGIEISNLGNLFGLGEVKLGVFAPIFTVFAIVGGINAFNMIDGIDGLAGSTSLIVYLSLSILFVFFGGAEFLIYCFVFASASLGFLLFNFPIPARKNATAFLGDTGSMLFGFTICCLIISASQGPEKLITPVTALWMIGAPILDTVCIMIRRIQKGQSPFAPDREHLHHILTVVGFDRFANLFIILLFGTILAFIGITADKFFKTPEWLMLALFLGVFFVYYWGMCHAWRLVKATRYLREYNVSGETSKTSRFSRLYPPLFANRCSDDMHVANPVRSSCIQTLKRMFNLCGNLYSLLTNTRRH